MKDKAVTARATFGPSVELPWYRSKDWSRWPKDVNMEDVWNLCGPTVMKHMDNLPLWKVFCTVYYEGLVHGSQAIQEKQDDQGHTVPRVVIQGTVLDVSGV